MQEKSQNMSGRRRLLQALIGGTAAWSLGRFGIPESFAAAPTGTLTLDRLSDSAVVIAGAGGNGTPFAEGHDPHFEVRPRGNGVSHEDEMLKLSSNQMDYDAVTSIYTHSIGLIKTAVR